MCEMCQKSPCIPGCPNRERPKRPGERRLRCRRCGGVLRKGSEAYEKNGNPYCGDCIAQMDLESLLRICEMEKESLLKQIGLLPIRG